MSLTAQVSSLATRIGTEFKAVYAKIGTLSTLTTTAKSDLVSAINEVKAGAASIDDASTSTGSVWSGSKTSSAIAQVKVDLVGTASSALDTFGEVQAAMAADETAAAALTTAVGNRVRVDAAQGLTGTQQSQARANIDVYSTAQVGDPTTDLVAVFNTALT